jgi:flagellar M-ring protein FliF
MDVVQRYLRQALALWGALGRSQQIALGVLAAAGLGLLFVLSMVGRTPDTAVAFANLSDEDASAVVEKLKEAKIPYELGERGTIRVPSALVNEVKVMMAGQGLGGKPATGSGFELFNQPAFGITEFAQKVNYQRALEAELARSIGRMDAVESVRVHLVIPQQSLFASQQKEPTASVILKLKPGKHLDSAQVRGISNLVAGSVEGLKPSNLAIVDVNGNTLTEEDGGSTPTSLTNKQMEAQRTYEAAMERDLQAFLDRVLGPSRGVVRVTAALDWDLLEETRKTFAPADGGTPQKRTEREFKESQTPGASPTNQAGGVPGPVANGGSVPTYQGATTSSQNGYEKTERQTTYELSESVQKIVRAPGGVKRLSVAVLLDENFVDAPRSEAIRAALATAVGIDTQGRGDQITVTALPFNQEQLEAARVVMAQAEQREQVLEYGRLAALALGPVLLLFVLWRVLGRRPDQRIGSADGVASGAQRTPGVADLQPAAPAPSADPAAIMRNSRPIAQAIEEDPQKVYVRDQVTSLARNNPATLAQLIQTWIDEDRRN